MQPLLETLNQIRLEFLVPIWEFIWLAFKILGVAFALLGLGIAGLGRFIEWLSTVANYTHDQLIRSASLATRIYLFSYPLAVGIVWHFLGEVLKFCKTYRLVEVTQYGGSAFDGWLDLLGILGISFAVITSLYMKVLIFRYARRMCKEMGEDFGIYGFLLTVVPLGSFFGSKLISERYIKFKNLKPAEEGFIADEATLVE